MPLDENAPVFFCAGIASLAYEGPNVIVSFGTPLPSPDNQPRKYPVNVRIVMARDALKQSLAWALQNLAVAEGGAATSIHHPMPQTPQ